MLFSVWKDRFDKMMLLGDEKPNEHNKCAFFSGLYGICMIFLRPLKISRNLIQAFAIKFRRAEIIIFKICPIWIEP